MDAITLNPDRKQEIKFKKGNKKSTIKMMKMHWQLYLIFLLPFLHVITFKYLPMYGVQIAFKNFKITKGIWGSPSVGFTNFTNFFSTSSCWKIILNTLTISIYGILAGVPFAILLAIALNECKSQRYKKIVQLVTYAPYFISTVVMVALLLQFLDYRLGAINIIIKAFGGKPINVMGEPSYFKSVYVWSGVWQGTGYSAIIYLAALSGINPELYEAVRIDGANRLQKIWHIDLPGIRNTVVILLILSVGYAMNVGFEKIFLMQNPLNLDTSEVISTYVYRVGLINVNYGFSTAVGLFNSVVNLILISSVNVIARKYGEVSLW